MTLPMIPTIKSVTDLRYQTAEIIKIIQQGQPVVVTRAMDTVAVMFSPVQYQQIVTFLDEAEDLKAAKKLEKAIEKDGKFIDLVSFDKRQKKKLKIT